MKHKLNRNYIAAHYLIHRNKVKDVTLETFSKQL